MAGHDDVVIADGVREEIAGQALVGELYHLLCTAQVWFLLVAQQCAFSDEMALQVARYLEEGDGALLHKPSDAYSDA